MWMAGDQTQDCYYPFRPSSAPTKLQENNNLLVLMMPRTSSSCCLNKTRRCGCCSLSVMPFISAVLLHCCPCILTKI